MLRERVLGRSEWIHAGEEWKGRKKRKTKKGQNESVHVHIYFEQQ